MIWLELVVGGLLLSFGGVLLVGAPYLPTLQPQVAAALRLAALTKGETLIELGCGDGRVVAAAAAQGLQVVGYELNPILAGIAWLRTRRYRRQVRIVWGNFWQREWPAAEAVFTFLLPKYMPRLDSAMGAYHHRPVKLVSFAFELPGRRPDAAISGVYLYHYPAQNRQRTVRA